MKHVLSVRCHHSFEDTLYQQLLIFSHRIELDPTILAKKLNEELSNPSIPDEIIIAVPTIVLDKVHNLLREYPALRVYTDRFSKTSTISLVGFCSQGKERDKIHMAGPRTSVSIPLHCLSRQIITNFYRRHGGFVESTGSYHFENPSGRHSKKFIRLANILIDGEEIGYMGFACLPFINKNSQYLYIDTPALHSVAATINEIRSIFQLPLLGVRNFHSYSGLEQIEVGFDNEEIFIISASSSGGLSRTLQKNFGVLEENIVHFLYLGNFGSIGKVVCDLRRDIRHNPEGYQDIPEVFSKGSCKYCLQGSVAIPLYGEQFDVINSQPEPVMINKSDSPAGLADSMRTFLGNKSLKVESIKDTAKGKRDFQIEFGNVLVTEKFKSKLGYVLKRVVPSNSSIIVNADKSQNTISEEIRKFINNNGGKVKVIDAEGLREHDSFEGNSIIVVAEVIESGRCLTNVSQALRENADMCPIVYIVGVEKTSATPQRKSLKNTLTQCRLPLRHEFVVIEQLVLPVSGGHNPWSDELKFLQTNRLKFTNSALEQIEIRIESLRESSISLEDNLFLTSESGGKLEIQKGFVFWPKKYDINKVTQADVYFTIASVLQNLRMGSKIKSFWHYQTVLHPKNFERFNDGVIRASLLRAASFGELDYSHYKQESTEMTQIILGILRASSYSAGMDAPEFLLALGTKKLRLRESDYQRIVEAASSNGGIIGALANCIASAN